MSKTRALVILSGGQDSVTCLAWAKQKYDEIYAITFNYGQRHKIELKSAKLVADMFEVDYFEEIHIDKGIFKGSSFLTDLNAKVEEYDTFDAMEHSSAFKDNKLDSSFVPGRNAIFMAIAANRAAVYKCETAIIGVTAADFVEFGEFSWEWLGGFIDAEGCINKVKYNGPKAYRMSISQNDPELFHRLGKWLKNQIPELTYGLSKGSGSNDSSFNMTFGKANTNLLMPLLSPHLHSDHRRQQATSVGIKLEAKGIMNDAYVTGFWEGDGGCRGTYIPQRSNPNNITRAFTFSFYQKGSQILEEIKEYMQCGNIYKDKHREAYTLTLSDGPISHKKLDRFRKHFNVMKSFEKISKWRHKIDLLAGGFNPPYPDCTPDFIHLMSKLYEQALLDPGTPPVKIEAPVMFLTKAQSVLLASSLPKCFKALAYSHTSYDGKYPPTGKNHANLLRAHGFLMAEFPDPLVVRANYEGLMDLPNAMNYSKEKVQDCLLLLQLDEK